MPISIKNKIQLGKMKLLAFIAYSFALCLASAQDIPKPVDKPYPGVIQLDVDATNLEQKIFKVHERIPVSEGKLILFYPQWLPGTHSPTGPLNLLAGLTLTANDKPLEWTRDKVEMYAFHVNVPPNVEFINADYQFFSPGFYARV